MNDSLAPLPRSLAIAGAWGYIGRKFLDVAARTGIKTYVFDPGPAPADVPTSAYERIATEAEFLRVPAEFFHLAVHPEHRRLDPLLDRDDAPLILNEKPMALPGRASECRALVERAAASRSTLVYDFPELFDPLTDRVLAFLSGFRDLTLTRFHVQRSKDREDPANPRNSKRMVDIQYQESVHCMAYALFLLLRLGGSSAEALDGPIRVEAESTPYAPPNPEVYPQSVDGRCSFRLQLGSIEVEGLTDFKSGAPWVKRRIIRGIGDGRPFEVEVSYLEGKKSLAFDGRIQPCDPAADSYESVLRTASRWKRDHGADGIRSGVFPNPAFTLTTYQLSAALKRACDRRREIRFENRASLDAWE